MPFLGWNGRICTADALHTQTALVAAIRVQGGHVVLTVKDNQPTLAADLAALFADPVTQVEQAHTDDAQRGRRERRSIRVSTDLRAYLATHSPWQHIAPVAQLTRTARPKGRWREETVYLVTTLPSEHASPQRLLEWVWGHWHIGNSLPYVRDVTFGEDRS